MKKWIAKQTKYLEIGVNIWEVDFQFDAFDDELKEMIKEIDKMKSFWGHGFEEPLVAIDNLRVRRSDIQVMGKKADTVKITCNGVAYMFFRRSEEEVRQLIAHDSVRFNIVGKANLNKYFNTITPQIFVSDYTMVNTELEF